MTQCRLDRSAPRSNGDLNQVLDETEAAWAVCADKSGHDHCVSGARQ
ncbi:Fels-2 prophage protein [Salmonella enterica subsp. enterica serovar Enteritidis str. 22558]|nr:Fels-2 prophage protein [Salmonella enterica subsp. enterica serovar Enteritidis str. 22558]